MCVGERASAHKANHIIRKGPDEYKQNGGGGDGA